MGSNNKLFTNKDNGLGLDLWYEKEPYTSTKQVPGWSLDSQRIPKYEKDESLPIYTSMFKNGEGAQSTAASYFVASSHIYNDDDNANDTGVTATVQYLQKWKSTWVDYADFAYLKNLGVYPTNRLMIARRFAAPTVNNIYQIDDTPIATMVSWMPEDDNFFEVSYGEVWEEVQEASLQGVLNSIGEDFSTKAAGDKAAGGAKIFSLPGWTEGIQIEVLKKLGYVDYEANNPPSGNPNLIKEAMNRKTVGKDRSGSGLMGKFSIKFVVEYEQKYINGLDPTLVYMDIIQKALMFGTSKSVFMFNTNSKTSELQDFMKSLISGNIEQMVKSLGLFLGEIINGMSVLITRAAQALVDIVKAIDPTDPNFPNTNALGSDAKIILGNVISKYRIKLFGILQSLTGAPSGYWHVTIGNPKKPFFSSGDLYTESVTLTFGKVLSFNDLPSTIKIEFTLGSARNLGGQEIMDAFNTGQGRTYFQRKRSYVEVPIGSSNNTPNTTQTDEQVNATDEQERLNKFKTNLESLLQDKKNNPGPT
jgi:hypothetical protein